MRPTDSTLSPPTAATLCCAVAARACVRATADGFANLKSALTLPDGTTLPAASLKHSDEQTVVALAAVLAAIQRYQLTKIDFTHWAVLAAPRFLGRQALAHTLQRFAAEGAWGISPHVIPHRLLHAVSGTISLTLHIHGPNFGIDGMPSDSGQLLATGLALVNMGQVPGVWAVMTGWEPEPIPARQGTPAEANPKAVCGAVALALTPLTPNWQGLRLRYCPPSAGSSHRNGKLDRPETARPLFSLKAILDTLGDGEHDLAGARWRLGGGGSLEFLTRDEPFS
ncbi:MAG TPA: hypothetical protein VFA18_14875 [Gemmataceae bacterium]|nr:hypothetical protein [Gemmataceae bacterium]